MKDFIVILISLLILFPITATADPIRDSCLRKWGTNYRLVNYCVNKQLKALDEINAMPPDEVRLKCLQKWKTDFRMISYCMKKKYNAKKDLSSDPSKPVNIFYEEKNEAEADFYKTQNKAEANFYKANE